jgi:hypothetical protein
MLRTPLFQSIVNNNILFYHNLPRKSTAKSPIFLGFTGKFLCIAKPAQKQKKKEPSVRLGSVERRGQQVKSKD